MPAHMPSYVQPILEIKPLNVQQAMKTSKVINSSEREEAPWRGPRPERRHGGRGALGIRCIANVVLLTLSIPHARDTGRGRALRSRELEDISRDLPAYLSQGCGLGLYVPNWILSRLKA